MLLRCYFVPEKLFTCIVDLRFSPVVSVFTVEPGTSSLVHIFDFVFAPPESISYSTHLHLSFLPPTSRSSSPLPSSFAPAGAEPPASKPYHVYIRRNEPQIVFGSIDAGVPNRKREDGLTFLDVLWNEAPFATHRAFTTAVARIAAEWEKAQRFTAQERTAVVTAAGKAEQELRTA